MLFDVPKIDSYYVLTHPMPNQIKDSGAQGVALQITKPARKAGLVEENESGDATRLAPVRVFSFDDLLIVGDLECVDTPDLTEVIITAAQETKSIHRVLDASVQIAGNGYQVQLPPATDAGFQRGDQIAVQTAPGMLFLSPSRETRLSLDLAEIRSQQVQH